MKVLWNGYEKSIRKALKAGCTAFTKRQEAGKAANNVNQS